MVTDISLQLLPDPGHSSRLDGMYRNSALAFQSKFQDSRYSPPLRLDIGVSDTLDAQAFGTIVTALQQSTATIAKGLLYPASATTRRTQADIDRAPLVSLGSFGNSFLFSFPSPVVSDQDQQAWQLDTDYTLTEAAVKELVSVMPRNYDDQTAIEVLPGQSRSIRNAMKTLAVATLNAGSIRLTLDLPKLDHRIESVLSGDQARGVGTTLAAKRSRTTEETVVATLDGLRTQRRIFYLYKENGAEIHGSVGPELLPQIRDHLGQPVVARLKKVVVEDDAGRRSRPVYSLLSLSVDQEIATDLL